MAVTATHLELKIVIDKEKKRVLFAEADGGFVDILFNFLTLPLGAIVKLIGKTQSKPTTIGCFSTLYQSAASLGNEHFRSEEFKDMLMHPKSSYENYWRRLRINITGEEASYFACPRDTSWRCVTPCGFNRKLEHGKCTGRQVVTGIEVRDIEPKGAIYKHLLFKARS